MTTSRAGEFSLHNKKADSVLARATLCADGICFFMFTRCPRTRSKAYALLILPERRQREQTATVLGVPSTIAFTLRMLGFHVLLVLRCEWDTDCPNTTPFPQMLHFAILTPPQYTNRVGSLHHKFIEHLLLYHIKIKNARVF